MSQFSTDTPVAAFVTDNEFCSTVFNDYGIDFCCRGQRSLASVCANHGLDAEQVLTELLAVPRPSQLEQPDLSQASALEIINDLIPAHQDYIEQALPQIREQLNQLEQTHRAQAPWLSDLKKLWIQLQETLNEHIFKEDQVLFPRIRQLCEQQDSHSSSLLFINTISGPICIMRYEHDQIYDVLIAIRQLCNNYAAPEHSDESVQALLDDIHSVELHMHRHIHRENNILFPKALQLEARKQVSDSTPIGGHII